MHSPLLLNITAVTARRAVKHLMQTATRTAKLDPQIIAEVYVYVVALIHGRARLREPDAIRKYRRCKCNHSCSTRTRTPFAFVPCGAWGWIETHDRPRCDWLELTTHAPKHFVHVNNPITCSLSFSFFFLFSATRCVPGVLLGVALITSTPLLEDAAAGKGGGLLGASPVFAADTSQGMSSVSDSKLSVGAASTGDKGASSRIVQSVNWARIMQVGCGCW